MGPPLRRGGINNSLGCHKNTHKRPARVRVDRFCPRTARSRRRSGAARQSNAETGRCLDTKTRGANQFRHNMDVMCENGHVRRCSVSRRGTQKRPAGQMFPLKPRLHNRLPKPDKAALVLLRSLVRSCFCSPVGVSREQGGLVGGGGRGGAGPRSPPG